MSNARKTLNLQSLQELLHSRLVIRYKLDHGENGAESFWAEILSLSGDGLARVHFDYTIYTEGCDPKLRLEYWDKSEAAAALESILANWQRRAGLPDKGVELWLKPQEFVGSLTDAGGGYWTRNRSNQHWLFYTAQLDATIFAQATVHKAFPFPQGENHKIKHALHHLNRQFRSFAARSRHEFAPGGELRV